MRTSRFGFVIVLSLLVMGLSACDRPGAGPPPTPKEEKKEAPKAEKKPCSPETTKPVKPAEPPITFEIQQILIAYSGNKNGPPPREARNKAQAEKLCKEVLEKARNCEDINKLVKDYSDDPYRMNDSKYNMYPGFFEISPRAVLDKNFRACATGLSPGNVDMTESNYGYHVIYRLK